MDGCPTTEWCRVSFWMVKVLRSARPNSHRSSDACSEQRSAQRTTRSGRNSRTKKLMVSRYSPPKPPLPYKSIYITCLKTNLISHLESQICDHNVHPHRLSHVFIAVQTHDRTVRRNMSNKYDNRAEQQQHPAKKRKILRQGVSLGPHRSKISPNAKWKQAKNKPSTMPPECLRGRHGEMRDGEEGSCTKEGR